MISCCSLNDGAGKTDPIFDRLPPDLLYLQSVATREEEHVSLVREVEVIVSACGFTAGGISSISALLRRSSPKTRGAAHGCAAARRAFLDRDHGHLLGSGTARCGGIREEGAV